MQLSVEFLNASPRVFDLRQNLKSKSLRVSGLSDAFEALRAKVTESPQHWASKLNTKNLKDITYNDVAGHNNSLNELDNLDAVAESV